MIYVTILGLLACLFWSVRTTPCLHKSEGLAKLTLPWGTWEATKYDEDRDIYVFRNVRFGKAPVDDLRFAAPQYPEPIANKYQVQDSSYGPKCIQADVSKEAFPEPVANGTESEDCLFLDVYVPSWALELDPNDEKLAVVVWIYGGAYVFGAKNTTIELKTGNFSAYDGKSIFDSSQGSLIWVTGNYRLGAYGFLAGSTMEGGGQPNAGLHDQRLLLDWVQKYIGQIGGDKDSVNMWGLSAGGGSIVHHLTAYGGKKDQKPLFKRAAIWSAAFQWAYDRKQTLEQTFLNFTQAAGCPRDASKALECLRKVAKDSDEMKKANQQIVTQQLALGMFPFGPAVDGDLVPELPASLLAKGAHVGCESLIVSHDYDEASLFLAKWVDTKDDFTKFLALAFPGQQLQEIRKSIEDKYPPVAFDFHQTTRMRQVLRDSTFVCNKQQVYSAYKNSSKVYAIRYDMLPAQHGSDLLAVVWNYEADVSDLIRALIPSIPDWMPPIFESFWAYFVYKYQRYFASHALTGDPNYLALGDDLQWEVTIDDGDKLVNSMKAGLLYRSGQTQFYTLGQDAQTSVEACDFWTGIAKQIAKMQTGSLILNAQNVEL